MKTAGRPLRVPALHQDGSEVDVELTLSATTRDGVDVIVASLRDMRDRVELERHGLTQRRLMAQYRVMACWPRPRTWKSRARHPACHRRDTGLGRGRPVAGRRRHGHAPLHRYWCAADETPHAFGRFLAMTLEVRFPRGVGLPGQTWDRASRCGWRTW
jgi:hypothetical protein